MYKYMCMCNSMCVREKASDCTHVFACVYMCVSVFIHHCNNTCIYHCNEP